jgi:hypothetical protein
MEAILSKHVGLLGMRARDKVTGVEGIVESVCFDLYGCVQVALRPTAKDGEIKSGHWLDIQRLVLVDHSRVMPLPSFANLATPEGVHTHGPAEKPVR